MPDSTRHPRRKSRNNCLVSCFIIIVLFISGCQRYEAKPLDKAAVESALAVPPEQALCVQAQSLKHPIIPPIVLNLGDGLSPDEASVLAVLNNPSLRAVRDRRDIAAGELIQAGLLPNPQLGLVSERVTGGNTANTVSAYSHGINWDVMELLSHSALLSAAKKHKESVYLDVAWQEWQIAEAAKAAVYDLLSLRSQLAIATDSDRKMEKNLDVVQAAMKKGLVTELDVSAAETASHQAHSTVLALQRSVFEQKLALNQIIGVSADANVILQEDIALPSSIKAPSTDELLKDLEKRRLDLVALHFGYDSQQENLRAAILNQFPRVNIGLTRARDTGNVVTTGFEISIDLPIFDLNQGQIAIERATRQQLFDEYVNRIFETRTDVAKLSANIPMIINQIETAQAAVTSGRKLVETYRKATEKGQADVLSYYNAWSDLNNRQIEIIRLRQQLVDSRIALELATGLYNLNEPEVSEGNSTKEAIQ
jgi:cobalt-zinc-cadmium efflux system outer membrane protein